MRSTKVSKENDFRFHFSNKWPLLLVAQLTPKHSIFILQIPKLSKSSHPKYICTQFVQLIPTDELSRHCCRFSMNIISSATNPQLNTLLLFVFPLIQLKYPASKCRLHHEAQIQWNEKGLSIFHSSKIHDSSDVVKNTDDLFIHVQQ